MRIWILLFRLVTLRWRRDCYIPLQSKGDAWTQSNLGVIYANGQGVLQDYQEAAERDTQGVQDAGSEETENRGVTIRLYATHTSCVRFLSLDLGEL